MIVVDLFWRFAGMLMLIGAGVGILLIAVLALEAIGKIRWK